MIAKLQIRNKKIKSNLIIINMFCNNIILKNEKKAINKQIIKEYKRYYNEYFIF